MKSILIFLVNLLILRIIKHRTELNKKYFLVAIFLIFIATSFLFILMNSRIFFFLNIVTGIITIPLSVYLFRTEISLDFKSSIVPFSMLLLSFVITVFYFSITDPSWALVLPSILIAPILIEEFNFRYLLQRLFLRSISPYLSLIVQALVYVLYYSKYVIADNGAGYPYPYNLLMLSSVFGMGIFYGLLAKFTKNCLLSSTVHFIIWSLFPILVHYPGLASTLIPT